MKSTEHSTGLAISSSTIGNCTVKSPSDEKVGKIKDIMINTMTGEVSYLVLAVDEGFLNMGSKLLALPWESFEFETKQKDVLIVKEKKEKLEKAPGFDDDNWPSGPQDEFIHDIRTYYGIKSRGTVATSETNTDKSNGEVDIKNPGINKQTINDYQAGSKFLEKDRTGERDLTDRYNNNPLTN